MMKYEQLEYIYEPSGNPKARTMLLLHGTGGDEKDLLSLAAYFGSGFNILSLRGNVSENGMPRFFRRVAMGIFDEQDLEFRSCEMVEFIKKLSLRHHFDSSKIVALGYSNGANMAGAVLTLSPDFLEGAILFRPMRPFKKKGPLPDKTATPVFITTGTHDPTIRADDTENYIKLLSNSGFDVTHFNLDAGHNLTQDDIDLASGWFKRLNDYD
ncbi:alpha/beta hydrolase [Pseudomonas shirazensis]